MRRADPTRPPEGPPLMTEALEAGCASFESTLALMDGELHGFARDAALDHARDCALCGPMVRGWDDTSHLMTAHFELAAERAKPDLSGLADRVLADLAPAARPAPGVWERLKQLLGGHQALGALAAAAAVVALVVWPQARMAESDAAGLVDDAAPYDVVVNRLAFEGADGMMYRTAQGDLVIWISEHDGV